MKTLLLLICLTVSAGLLCADILYVTGRGTTIRRSTDNGVTWSPWVTFTGAEFRGIAADDNYVYVVNYRSIDVPPSNVQVRAYRASDAAYLALTSFTTNGAFNQTPVACWNQYVLANSGQAGGASQATGKSYFDGTYFTDEPMANAGGGTWQANDMRAYSTPGGLRMYANGSGAADINIRRWNMAADGTLSGAATVTISGPGSGGANATRDFAFSPSGRLIVLNTNGIWVSGTGQFNSSPITVTRVFEFSMSEDTASGSMGPNARELLLLENRLYGATDSRVFRYTFNDSDGSITYVDAYLHGHNNTLLHLDGVVPEPGVIGVALVAGMVALRKRG